MSLATDLYIGPVQGSARNLEVAWKSTADANGFRAAAIGVALPIGQAEQLSELVANSARRITVGGASGVLEPIWFDGPISRDFNGWYLLQALSFDPYGTGDWVSHVPVSLDAVHLGSRQPVVTRSARSRPNAVGVTAQPLAVDPFTSGSFLVSPGGTAFTREYDAGPYDVTGASVHAESVTIYKNPMAVVLACAPSPA